MSNSSSKSVSIDHVLEQAVQVAASETRGKVADYIPELTQVPPDLTAAVVRGVGGKIHCAGSDADYATTLQSAAKLVVLIGMLEEKGLDGVRKVVKVEPSGDDFASVARLDQFGPLPSNPMLNSGAIALCSMVPGTAEEKIRWLEGWATKLFGENLAVDPKVYASERRTGHRNRALAYLLRSRELFRGNVEDVLDTYFYLCSLKATVMQASYLPMLLAGGGKDASGGEIFSPETARCAISIMATCGLYNETGSYMVRTGLPAKSSVSGYILAVAVGRAGIATLAPPVNRKGTSLRGSVILEHLSRQLGWHFATH